MSRHPHPIAVGKSLTRLNSVETSIYYSVVPSFMIKPKWISVANRLSWDMNEALANDAQNTVTTEVQLFSKGLTDHI